MEQFEAYFQKADADRDGRVSGKEAIAFFQATNLPKPVLAQIWMYADQNQTGFLGRPEFYNALKLVTVAQSKRELTPDLVKAALYGPASAKIPAPQISFSAAPGPQTNIRPGASPAQASASPTSAQGTGASGQLGFPSQQSQIARPPRPAPPSSGLQSQLSVPSQGMPNAGFVSVPHRPTSPNLLGGSTGSSQAGMPSQVLDRSLTPTSTQGGFGSTGSSITQAKTPDGNILSQSAPSRLNDTASLSPQVGKEDFKSLTPSGNGFSSDSVFGDVFSVTPSQPKQSSSSPPYSAGMTPNSTVVTPTSSRDQPTIRPNAVSQPPPIPGQQFQTTGKANQSVLTQNSSTIPVHVSPQSQPPWPRMSQSDIQKYSKVFVQVDTDRDGKITGEQARNLFLSWRLPREVLKQVWDLSDQDHDSMLSLREFCVALYLMERYREGRPLPAVLPTSVISEGILPAPGQPAGAYGSTPWRPPPGLQQPQGAKNARPVTSVGGGRPPRPVPIPQPDEPVQQKAKVPELEKHLVDQLSTEEQDALNKKFQEAKDAETKVTELEKEILEAKQKIQFYHAKMQELILYKSRCDNRLNEITEKVVVDKREAESLAKKYEEKYKQVGDVASKLTIEEATFRDIQEKKMELYRAIVKMEQGDADGIQDRANQIQKDLEELVKALNERCKTYGVRGKPTSLVELPFGWQPGIESASADWDEVWDKFEDEGFTYVKELTLDVENVIAPPKPKSSIIRENVTHLDTNGTRNSPKKADEKSELTTSGKMSLENDRQNADNLEQTANSPPDSPARSNAVESPSKELHDINVKGSPRFDTQSEYGGADSVLSGDRGFDEPGWGSFDAHYDSDAWDFNSSTPKGADHEKQSENSLFGADDWGLNPIRTGSNRRDSTTFPNQGPFFDSVPSTPLYSSANSPNAGNLFTKSSPFAFADSVPSTPMYNSSSTSPRRFSEGPENQYSFDSFSRFDSFNMHDSGPFDSRESLTRFDSMRSTRDSDFDQGYAPRESLARFDSFRSTADSVDYNFGAIRPPDSFTRFDSMRSTRDSDYGHGFPSFDDTPDPFGTPDPFRTSLEAQTPRRDSDSWKAF